MKYESLIMYIVEITYLFPYIYIADKLLQLRGTYCFRIFNHSCCNLTPITNFTREKFPVSIKLVGNDQTVAHILLLRLCSRNYSLQFLDKKFEYYRQSRKEEIVSRNYRWLLDIIFLADLSAISSVSCQSC